MLIKSTKSKASLNNEAKVYINRKIYKNVECNVLRKLKTDEKKEIKTMF